jgi:CRISPR/Cas system CSM-associated protein Csm5 (group 7 of RAMP superfamily)
MEDKIFNTYNIAVKTLSPVHVGMGQERNFLRGLDFVVDNSEIKILNNNVLLKELKAVGQLQTLTAKLSTGKYAEIESFLKPFLKIEGVVSQVYALNGNPREDIKRQIVTGLGDTIIPGSSIKGALRSVLLADLKQKQGKHKDEKAIFGTITDNLMRFIRVADLTFKNDDKRIYPTKIFSGDGDPLSDKKGYGMWKDKRIGGHAERLNIEGFESYYEAIKSNSNASLQIQIGSDLPLKLKDFATNRNIEGKSNVINYATVVLNKSIEDLLSIIRNHTNNYIDKEIAYFTEFKNDAFDLRPKLQEIRNHNNDQNSCVLRIGAGVGFHSITGDWQEVSEDHFSSWIDRGEVYLKNKQKVKDHYYKKLDNQIFAKTRKILIGKDVNENRLFFPMGFMKLTYIE